LLRSGRGDRESQAKRQSQRRGQRPRESIRLQQHVLTSVGMKPFRLTVSTDVELRSLGRARPPSNQLNLVQFGIWRFPEGAFSTRRTGILACPDSVTDRQECLSSRGAASRSGENSGSRSERG